ncbi:DNL-type zinc finger protein [Fasciola gigantica]|uniref:DNL-type zinc finger protein n=1 Tax=Fasciola gigantica TaxID=46835 RepID=A0A504YHQ5_FASGI|nr:DNL-type zinc finger protein [Fasciola gigantica]
MLTNRFLFSLRIRTSSSLRALPACVQNYVPRKIIPPVYIPGAYFPRRGFCTGTPSKSVVLQNPAEPHNSQADVSGKMYIEFTCKKCNHRSKKYFSKKAYLHGIVIIRCDGCENLHLIADNVGWIKDDRWRLEDVVKVDHKYVWVT